MKMKNKLLLLLVLINVSGVTNSVPATTLSPETTTGFSPVTPATVSTPGHWEWTTGQTEWTTGRWEWTTGRWEWTTGQWEWTTDSPGLKLRGKMFTLSANGQGQISLYPGFSPRRFLSEYFPWTTSAPSVGVSVCLRYVTDYLETKSFSIFTLSPSSNPLQLGVSAANTYWLSSDRSPFRNLYLEPSMRIFSSLKPEVWTRVCVTVDSRRSVAQVFSGSNMSIRKFLLKRYMWSGEEQIVFSGFNGQVTDVQVWDHPLRYGEVHSYMSGGAFRPYRGSVLSWPDVRFSARGQVVLEEAYEWQGRRVVGGRGRGRELMGRKTRRFFTGGENHDDDDER